MGDLHTDWVRERATSFTSCDPDSPLTDDERAAVDRMAGEAGLVALGEAAHGSEAIIRAAGRVLRFLIRERGADVVVIEACFAATHALDRYVVRGEGEADEAVVAVGGWNYGNEETLRFTKWLRDHNRSPAGATRPVRVFGCDCQSIDGPKAQLLGLVQAFVGAGALPQADAAEAAGLLSALPTDRDLGVFAELMVRAIEMGATDVTDAGAKLVEDINAWQSEFTATVPASLEKATRRLRGVRQALLSGVSDDDRFGFERCGRQLEQAVAFYSPGDPIAKRDAFMAENVLAVRRHFRPRRLVLLAHNLHIARAAWSIRGHRLELMGHSLARELGDDYRAIGSAFHGGRYLAAAEYRPEDDLVEEAHTPGPLAVESALRQVAAERRSPGLLVGFGGSDRRGSEPPWPDGVEMLLGETGRKGGYGDSFVRLRPEEQYDGLLFVGESSPIRILPGYYRRAAEQWGPGHAGDAQRPPPAQ
jgi:erythromycin esterase